MGLDITTKEGYARFNWSSAGAFQGWCEKHLHKNPFFQWSGFNGDEVQLKGEALTEAKEWMVALEKYCARIGDNILNFSESELIGEVASRMYALGKKEAGLKEQWYKDSQIQWDYIQAVKWYKLIKSAVETGDSIYYGNILNFIQNYNGKYN